MKFIGKHLNLIGILLLTVFVGAAAGIYFDVPARLQNAMAKSVASEQYTCPMHSDVVSAKPGNCPKCGMALVSASEAKTGQAGCCTEMNATESATELKLPPGHPPIQGDKLVGPHAERREMELPPGHPPIHGWPTNATPESAPALSNAPATSPH